MNKDIIAYNRKQNKNNKIICLQLAKEINQVLFKTESKIWHGSPVWFIDENPIVGYHALKDCVRLLFWSGQTFKERGLVREGSFKAAGARYTKKEQINSKDIKRWLKKSKKIQWDYKNIVKRRGKLVRLK